MNIGIIRNPKLLFFLRKISYNNLKIHKGGDLVIMVKRIATIIIIIIGVALGASLTSLEIVWNMIMNLVNISDSPSAYLITTVSTGLSFGIIFYIISPGLIRYSVKWYKWAEEKIQNTPTNEVTFGVIGLIVGLIIANLLRNALIAIPWIGPYLPIPANILLGYLGLSVSLKKKEDLFNISIGLPKLPLQKEKTDKTPKQKPKILDTSVIIDGRIADICKTGFVEGTLLIPGFVLEELRHIADSSDLLKRNRGRRGLDILNKIQKELNMPVVIDERDFDDVAEVDSKLVKLAKVTGGYILTNDYNLNKVAELQGVKVLNINELANAVKPIVLPGEEMVIQIIKDGKETGQGVAYLDDGTMIVVEGGRRFIGETIGVMVTSVLQTAAGRMIFAKPKAL